MLQLDFTKYIKSVERRELVKDVGKITDVVGSLLVGYLPGAKLGSICKVSVANGQEIGAEVIGFKEKKVLLMPYGNLEGIGFGSKIELEKSSATIKVGDNLLGRVINGIGEPIDDKGPLSLSDEYSLYHSHTSPMERESINDPLDLGVKSINGFLTVGRGQRVCILAGSGVGKSVLLGMMAKRTEADVTVVALIGERGREVKDFIEESLGEEGLKKSVIVAVTSDESPLMRMRGAYVATSISEYFCAEGKNVLLVMDSLTRFAMAQREIGLNAGEPPTTKGYTPSVFSVMPKLLERAGSFKGGGSITGLYTVLIEGDDLDDPVGDTVRSIVDGHIVLSRKMAHRGHYPAIDVLKSASRVMNRVITSEHKVLAQKCREWLALYEENSDLINIGAYQVGVNPSLDQAIKKISSLEKFLKQEVQEKWTFKQAIVELEKIVNHG